ncbi:MAG TPA: hypothetical protein VM120_25205 [Bryobacteraceae bacterium]|nr:hypothetical protein [Bryobacteraceae bacterium]
MARNKKKYVVGFARDEVLYGRDPGSGSLHYITAMTEAQATKDLSDMRFGRNSFACVYELVPIKRAVVTWDGAGPIEDLRKGKER